MSLGGGFQGVQRIDRRSVLKTTGVAAGAGVLGVDLGSVAADPDANHYVIASDTHLGSPFANTEDFRQFLTEDVPAIDPDAFVLAGDAFEFWWRGESSTLLENADIASYLAALDEASTEVTLVAGNHDRRLVDVGIDDWDGASPGSPWRIGDRYFFESGGREFVVRHGDGPDPLQYNALSQALCKGDDRFGKMLLDLYDSFQGITGAGVVGETSSLEISATLGADSWQTVDVSDDVEDPVAFTSPVSFGSPAPVQARVSNDDGSWFDDNDSFDVRLERLDDPDGDHPTERVHSVVLDQGRNVLGGDLAVEVGRVSVDGSSTTISFSEAFDEPPLVFTAVQTTNTGGWWFSGDSDVVASAVRDVSSTGFTVGLQTPDGGAPAEQDVAYLAIEPGEATVGAGSVTADTLAATDGWTELSVRQQADGSPPPFLVERQDVEGDEAATVRYRTAGSVSIRVQGDSQAGTIAYLVLDDIADIAATASTTFDGTSGGDGTGGSESLADRWNSLLESVETDALATVPDEPPRTAGYTLGNTFRDHIRESLLEEHPDKFVLYGHTHVPGIGDRWANAGCWTERGGTDDLPTNTFVEVKNGEVTLWNWTPDGRDEL